MTNGLLHLGRKQTAASYDLNDEGGENGTRARLSDAVKNKAIQVATTSMAN